MPANRRRTRTRQHEPANPPIPVESGTAELDTEAFPPMICVVQPDRISAELMANRLRGSHVTAAATSLEEVRDRSPSRPIELILVSKGHDLDSLVALRSQLPGRPRVVVTGVGPGHDEAEYPSDVDGFVPSTGTVAEFVELVEALLGDGTGVDQTGDYT